MEENKAILKKELIWKCREHPNLDCQIINLDEYAKDRVLCFNCMKKSSYPLSSMFSMNCILQAKDDEVIEGYPPLNDPGIFTELLNINQKQGLDEIDSYFHNLRTDVEAAIRETQKKAKEGFIQFEAKNQAILDDYFEFAEIEKLKQLIVSDKITAEKDLTSFIIGKCKNAQAFQQRIQNCIDQIAQFRLSFEGPKKIAKKIINKIQNVKFFQSENEQLQSFKWIKSTLNTSQWMEITKLHDSTYEIQRNENLNSTWNYAFLDPILNPLEKYVFHIEIETAQGNNPNTFLFGLVRDQEKDELYASQHGMTYYHLKNGYGISKQIKGRSMQSQGKKSGKYSFEMRIHLNQKIVRLASLPTYSSIVELDNPNKIDPKVDYRLYVSMYYQGDKTRITKMEIVDSFDDNM